MIRDVQIALYDMVTSTTPESNKSLEAIKAAAVPGGGVVYSVGVRALQELEQEGAFPQPSSSSPSRSQRGKASPPPPAARRRGKAATR